MTASLHWFRDDLRLADNPALSEALSHGPTLCIYILDREGDRRRLGGASCWWLSRSLKALSDKIAEKGGTLLVFEGDPAVLVPMIAEAIGADHVTWNRRYERREVALDTALRARLQESGLSVTSCNAGLLHEPWSVTTKAGTPMKVFTPFWRAARGLGEPAEAKGAPRTMKAPPLPGTIRKLAVYLGDLGLEPTRPDWAGGLREAWTPGEDGAADRLSMFLANMAGYAEGRERPDKPATSQLSPHLRFGEIGPRQIWQAVQFARHSDGHRMPAGDVERFETELGWREFSHHVLFHSEDLAKVNVNRRFDAFPWRQDAEALKAWQKGMTGYPIVDAGMRQLWTTGWMHNRVRMIVASFLVKHLLIDWRDGEAWFWDTLVDADPGNNPMNWQWVAGSGADAAPYFRIFNPVTQGEKFDPKGAYVREWVPEIAELPDKFVHAPWTAGSEVLGKAKLTLGKDYPKPVVDLDAGRERALVALREMNAARGRE